MTPVAWVLAAIGAGLAGIPRLRQWRRSRKAVAAASAQLRRAVLERTLSEDLTAGSPDAVTAVVMDWSLGANAVATLAAMSDGTTSLYLSQGGGVLGAGAHEAVRGSAERFRATATGVRTRFQPTDDLSVPKSGHTRFFLVTPAATLATVAVRTTELSAGGHVLSPLGTAAQDVITRIRKV